MVPADLKAEAIRKAVAAKEKADMEDSDDEAPKPAVVHTSAAEDTPPVIDEHSDEEPPMV